MSSAASKEAVALGTDWTHPDDAFLTAISMYFVKRPVYFSTHPHHYVPYFTRLREDRDRIDALKKEIEYMQKAAATPQEITELEDTLDDLDAIGTQREDVRQVTNNVRRDLEIERAKRPRLDEESLALQKTALAKKVSELEVAERALDARVIEVLKPCVEEFGPQLKARALDIVVRSANSTKLVDLNAAAALCGDLGHLVTHPELFKTVCRA